MGSVKRQGAVKIGMEKSDEKGEQKPHIQFLCTAPLYSTKHTVVLIRSCSLHSTQPHQPSPNTSHLSVRKPSIQLLCTAHLYSAKHTVVVIRIYNILITFMDYISFLLSKTRDMIWQGSMICENLVSVSYSVMSSAYCLVTFHFLSFRGEAKR